MRFINHLTVELGGTIPQEFLNHTKSGVVDLSPFMFSRNHFIALMLRMRRSGFATSVASLIEKYAETKTFISQHFPTPTAT